MISCNQIHNAYIHADECLSLFEERARTASGKNKWNQARMFNDHAYFLLLFA